MELNHTSCVGFKLFSIWSLTPKQAKTDGTALPLKLFGACLWWHEVPPSNIQDHPLAQAISSEHMQNVNRCLPAAFWRWITSPMTSSWIRNLKGWSWFKCHMVKKAHVISVLCWRGKNCLTSTRISTLGPIDTIPTIILNIPFSPTFLHPFALKKGILTPETPTVYWQAYFWNGFSATWAAVALLSLGQCPSPWDVAKKRVRGTGYQLINVFLGRCSVHW